jgi:hypothetical protein
MAEHPFDPPFERLPGSIAIFPLSGAVLLPRGRLPLNIFEPRYLAMTRDALAGEHRLIGMIQPLEPETADPADHPAIYKTGCAGRIISFNETDDGRFQIVLAGLARFDVGEEIATTAGYRRVAADWSRYRRDLDDDAGAIDRPRLLARLRDYFKVSGLKADWSAVEGAPDERLVTTLTMVCPFRPSEKQALLESPDLASRAAVMTTLIEMALTERGGENQPRH